MSIASRLKQRKVQKRPYGKDKNKNAVERRPEYFDLEPFKTALKKFLKVDARMRVS